MNLAALTLTSNRNLDAEKKHRARVEKSLKEAKASRAGVEPFIRDAYLFTMPTREFGKKRAEKRDEQADFSRIYDSTAVAAVRNLNTTSMKLLIPQNQSWAEVEFANRHVNQKLVGSKYKKLKENAKDDFFQHLQDSNFYLAVQQALYDGIIAGTFCIMIVDEEGSDLGYLPVPIDEVYFLEDNNQRVSAVFREHKMRAIDIAERFRDNIEPDTMREFQENPDKTHDILESVMRQFGSKEFIYCVTLKKQDTCLKYSSTKYNPFIVARWERVPKQTWGNSPVISALGSIKTSNAVGRDTLMYGAYAANGAWFCNDEDYASETVQKKLRPGALVSISGEIKAIPFPGQFPLNFEMQDRANQQTKTILLDGSPIPDKMQYTKAEAVVWMRQDFMARVGEPALLLAKELLQPMAEQIFARKVERGDIELMTPEECEEAGFEDGTTALDLFRIDINAAIKRVLKAQEAQDGLNAYINLIQVFGEAKASAVVKDVAMAQDIAPALGVPKVFVRDMEKNAEEQTVEAVLAQRAQAQAAAAAAQAMAQQQPQQQPIPGM